MLSTFVIGLREGVEASLIVGIVAAFLRQQRRTDALRWMWAGVITAVLLCTGVAVLLQVIDEQLPQQQQEGLETIVAAIAVGMVTFMIVWMRRHARDLAGDLRREAASALASGSAWGLVAMAFFAVIREGLETAVFLLAAFQASGNATDAGIGATLGIVLAVLIGWGIYRGGVRLDLARFFKATAVVLVLVAAGLVASALHTAHEATWLNGLQGQALDLTWLVHPGTISSSLLIGILGLQPRPTTIEVAGWLLYAIPMLLYVVWPERWRTRKLTAVMVLAGSAAIGLAACGSSGSGDRSSSGDHVAEAGTTKLRVTLTDQGCSPARLTAPSGPITFAIEGGSAAVTEMELKNGDGIILGERENVAPGLSSSFTLDVAPGRYVMSCPNGEPDDDGVLLVTGTARDAATPAPADVTKATDGYRTYVSKESETLLKDTRAFVAALRGGDVEKAKALFGPTRIHYEAIEPVAESFGDLDPEIDARVNDVDDRTRWTGFHRIEQILWVEGTTTGTEKYADKLLRDVQTLTTKVKTLRFQAPQLANGAVELLNEVANVKITGEEDRYSHTDLSDFQGNLDGAQKAFELLAPVLQARSDGALVRQIEARFADVQKSLAAYRRSTPLGYAVYSELTPHDRRTLAQQVDALAEPLSTVAAKVTA
ncbi:MAG: hypothetical protein JWQ48_520 [Conexibacter sp.]|nr:hypothetical protein [Conexibacter sp.]